MKVFIVSFYNNAGEIGEVLIEARNKISATRKFYIRCGYYTIKEIKEN